jgi:Flp pilus assembly protein TadG
LHSIRRAKHRATKRAAGQTLVEFALVFPLFWTMVLGIIDFSFAFNAMLSVDHASRSASLVAAEAGSATGADCVILNDIEAQISAPASSTRVTKVQIYQTTGTGAMVGSPTEYSRTGSTTCTFSGGATMTVPYSRTANGYPETSRCNVLAGCIGHSSLDFVGVRITYVHRYVTPLHAFIGGGNTLGIDRSNAMRMEPVL